MRCRRLLSVLLGLCLGLALASAAVIDARAARVSSDADDIYRLPEGFLFGGGTSAYQTEGAWNQDGKGLNVFDYFYHAKNYTQDRTGDVAADSYNRYKEDIALAAQMQLNVLRISISWARIFPDGDVTKGPNALGVKHYHDVLTEMKNHDITPLVTIFHFDYPQALEDKYNGWLGSEMADEFAKFADFVFGEYTEVKHWLTVNEASMYCNLAGGMGMVPPGTMTTSEKKKTCLHNLIRGHAKAYKIYQQKYKHLGGLVGFGVGPQFSRASSESDEDKAAADKANLRDGGMGCSIEPFFTGDYPEACKSSDRKNFTSDEKEMLLGSIDFAGVNVYGGSNASASGGGGGDDGPGGGGGPPGGGGGPGGDDDGSGGGPPGGGDGPPGGGGGPPGGGGSGGGGPPGGGGGPGGEGAESAWVLREIPKWINKRYNNLPVFFTETGAGTGTGIDDWETRAVFASAYLRECVAGVNVDKNKVLGVTMWSFIDTFEFGSYDMGWGMVHVDYKGKTLNRTLKTSSRFFKQMMQTRVVPLVTASTTTASPVTKPAPVSGPTRAPKPDPVTGPTRAPRPDPVTHPSPIFPSSSVAVQGSMITTCLAFLAMKLFQ